jgi:acyl-CoA hydrolase
VVIVASNYSHGVPALGRQRRFVAINSAVEVALDGSVNAEQVGDRVVSGPGGQPDFAAGAALSVDGLSIVALPSTTRPNGSNPGAAPISRIVGRLSDEVPVTVPRYLADRVVTEYGVARLRGIDSGERAERLLAIADPDHGPGR